jgi:hypothetical protein
MKKTSGFQLMRGLYDRLVKEAKRSGIDLRQSYERVAKKRFTNRVLMPGQINSKKLENRLRN